MASSHDPTAIVMLLLLFSIVSIHSGGLQVAAQQPYGTEIADCTNQHNSSGLLGYFCSTSGSAQSCSTYLTFTARSPHYSTLAAIAALLDADPSTILAPPTTTNSSSSSSNASLPDGTRVLVPATCACTATAEGRFYQRNVTTYVAVSGDTLFIIANDTFQGLTSCQALQAQALHGAPPQSLNASQPLRPVPLRCACPTSAQKKKKSARFLVSYLVDVTDEMAGVAARFGVAAADVAAANELEMSDTIYPYTTLLVPVAAQPNVSRIQTPAAPPPPPTASTAAGAPDAPGKNRVGVYVAVAVAAVVAFVAIASAGAFLALRSRRRRKRTLAAAAAAGVGEGKGKAGKKETSSSGFTTLTGGGGGEFSLSTSEAEALSSVSVTADMRSSLKVYTYAELMAATDGFSAGRRIGGESSPVYRAEFGGDAAAAVEVVEGRDVAAEVETMRRTNHLSLVRLVGVGHHRGRWFLVTELADGGSLRHRLVAGNGPPALTWAQRVRVALDVAEGLRYLHEYARPAWVHMDVSSATVLLAAGDGDGDAGPRAKLRGFAAARAITGATTGVGEEEEALFTMTSTIAGTRGYAAPEYLEHGVVSPKADVYSLGVVLLELVTGKDAEEMLVGDDGDGGVVGDPFVALRELVAEELDGNGGDGDVVRRRRRRLEELVDPALPAGSCPLEAVVVVVRLIERCVRRDPAQRPTAGEVARRLLKLSGVSVLGWRNNNSPPESPRSSSGSEKGLM